MSVPAACSSHICAYTIHTARSAVALRQCKAAAKYYAADCVCECARLLMCGGKSGSRRGREPAERHIELKFAHITSTAQHSVHGHVGAVAVVVVGCVSLLFAVVCFCGRFISSIFTVLLQFSLSPSPPLSLSLPFTTLWAVFHSPYIRIFRYMCRAVSDQFVYSASIADAFMFIS